MKGAYALAGIALLGVIYLALIMPKPVTLPSFGATPGGDFTNPVTFFNGYALTGAVATSSQGNVTVSTSEFQRWVQAATVAFAPGLLAGATVTLPASSSIPFIVPKAGDRQTFCIRNATTTAGVYTTLAGATGVNLLVASSSATALGSKVLLTGKVGCITLVRQPATATTFDIDALLTVYQ